MITFALCFTMGKAFRGGGTFPKCKAGLGYQLVLGPLFWECPPPRGFILYIKSINIIRDIRKVRKRQQQYPEVGHTEGEIEKKPAIKVH
jgi:hypothetical protein